MGLQYIDDIAPAIEHRYLMILIHIQASVWYQDNNLDMLIEESIKHYQPHLQEKEIERLKKSTKEKIPIKTLQHLFTYAQQNFAHHEQSTPACKPAFSSGIATYDSTYMAVSFWDTLTTKIKSNIDKQVLSNKEIKSLK